MQEFVDRLDTRLTACEGRLPKTARLRQIPMDMVALAVMRQLARDHAPLPFTDDEIDTAIFSVLNRN